MTTGSTNSHAASSNSAEPAIAATVSSGASTRAKPALPAPRLRSSHQDTGTSRQSNTIATSRGLREARPIQTNSGYSANSTPTTTGSRRGDRRGPAAPRGFGALAAGSCALASAGIVQACGCAFAAAFAAWPARTNAASDWIEW